MNPIRKVFFLEECPENTSITAADVCLCGLNIIMPLMSEELLKFPSLGIQVKITTFET